MAALSTRFPPEHGILRYSARDKVIISLYFLVFARHSSNEIVAASFGQN